MKIVMIVDDEKTIEELFIQRFRKELKAGAIEFIFAFSGEEALKKLQNSKSTEIVMILSDINMPGMNGLELLKIVKEHYSHISVFMVTAYSDDNNRKIAEEYGADDFITKPVDFTEMKKKLLGSI